MRMYGDDSTRRFDDVVINAGVQYDAAGAFLLGLDVSTICSSSERKLVKSFLPKLTEGGALTLFARSTVRTMDEPEEQEVMAGALINAFEAGFNLR